MTSGTLKEKVYAAVLCGIIGGKYTCATRISEKQLAEQHQVSKAPVREALVQLCTQGILRSEPRSGYRLVAYTDKNIRNMLEYRMLLECGNLRECFDQLTETQINRLESICESEFMFLGHGGKSQPQDYWKQTMDFHLTLASFSENEFIYSRLDSALRICMLAYLQKYPLEWQDAFRESSETTLASHDRQPSVLHRDIVAQIRKKDKEKTLEMLRRDILTFHIPEEPSEQ